MSFTVALFLHTDNVSVIEAIAHCMPVWIASTPEHVDFKSSLKLASALPSITWFPLQEEETLETASVRISFSLDDHYNALAKKDGYRFLLVFGARYVNSMEEKFRELGFKTFESTDFGFILAK